MIIQKNISLKKFSTFGVGGTADFFCEIFSKEDLQEALTFAEKNSLPLFILGGGSNLLFSDKGLRCLVLHLKNNTITHLKDGVFEVEAGTKMGEILGISKKAQRDFSLLSTIPGTIGGAVAGNAGIKEQEIQEVFLSATLYDREKKEFCTKEKEFFDFGYRKSIFHTPKISDRYIIWKVSLNLPANTPEKIDETLKSYFAIRKEKQPWGKTGGSFFSNPPEGAAGFFLEQSGMKGACVGDAFFSEKHANFLMNKKNATQEDIKKLAKTAQKTVKEKYNVTLTPEVKILNEWGKREEL
jgi:UDP-N-acetylmuramate dehydrogenase